MKYYFIELAEHVTANSANKNGSIDIIDDSNTVVFWVQGDNQVLASLTLHVYKEKELKERSRREKIIYIFPTFTFTCTILICNNSYLSNK